MGYLMLDSDADAPQTAAPPLHLRCFNPDGESINYIELKRDFYTAPPAKLRFYPQKAYFYPCSTVYIPAPPDISLLHQLNFRVNDNRDNYLTCLKNLGLLGFQILQYMKQAKKIKLLNQ